MARHLRVRHLLWGVLVALLLLSITALLLRDALVSVAVGRALARRGLRCDPILVKVPLAVPPSPIELGSTRCQGGEGPLASLELKGPIEVQLDGFAIGSLTGAWLEVDLRARRHREVELNAVGDMTRIVGLDRAALDLMFDAAELSSGRAPPLVARHAVIRRDGKVVMALHGFRMSSSGDGLTVSAPETTFAPAPLLGEGSLQLKATPTAAVVTVAYGGGLKVTIVLDHIDASRPKADFSLAMEAARGAR